MELIYNPDYIRENESAIAAQNLMNLITDLPKHPSDCMKLMRQLDESRLTAMLPTIEEIMFFMIKGGTSLCGDL